MFALATLIVASATVAGTAPAPSDARILRAIGPTSDDHRARYIRRRLQGDFDGDGREELAVLLETIDRTDYNANCRLSLHVLEPDLPGLRQIAIDGHCGYWDGERSAAAREEDRGPTLDRIDVDGDSADELLCRCDQSPHGTGASAIRARIYRWSGGAYHVIWDETVDAGSSGARSPYPYEYRTAMSRVRAADGSLHVVLTACETRTDHARGPYYTETRHKAFAWDGTRLALTEDRLVSRRVIDEETRKRMEEEP